MPRAEDTGGLFRLAMAGQQTNSEPSMSLQGLSNSDQATLVAGGARADRQAIIEKAGTRPSTGLDLASIRVLFPIFGTYSRIDDHDTGQSVPAWDVNRLPQAQQTNGRRRRDGVRRKAAAHVHKDNPVARKTDTDIRMVPDCAPVCTSHKGAARCKPPEWPS